MESPSFAEGVLWERGFAKNRSNPNLIKFDFYNLISLINKFYTKWIASGDAFAMTMKNKFAILNNNVALAHCVIQGVKTPCCSGYAFSCALKNKFEIISHLNYGFCYKNYFFNLNQVFRNSYDFGERFGRNLNYDFEKNYNFGFGKNYFGDCNFGFDFGNEIYSIWHDLRGFLFNRKTKKINLCQRIALAKENKNEENSSNNSSFAFYGKRKRIRYVWS